MNKKYEVTITEKLVKTVQIEAEDEEAAYELAGEMIADEEIVLDADDFFDRDIVVVKEIT